MFAIKTFYFDIKNDENAKIIARGASQTFRDIHRELIHQVLSLHPVSHTKAHACPIFTWK